MAVLASLSLTASGAVAPGAALATPVAGPAVIPATREQPVTRSARTPPARHYLALGDSLGAGYQVDRGDDRSGGFAGPVGAGLRDRGQDARLTNLSCTGETSATMLEGGRCQYPAGSQLAQATAFLRAHPRTTLVTVAIGANDARACVDGTRVRLACIEGRLRALEERLARLLEAMRRAAPQARVVVLDYYNPYLAASLAGASRLASINSTFLQFRLNSTIGQAASRSGARVARVAEAFDSNDVRRVEVPGLGRVARNLARICEWTWMCDRTDIHANDTGYAVIARAVLGRLDR